MGPFRRPAAREWALAVVALLVTSVSVYDLVHNVLHPGHPLIVAFHITLSQVVSVLLGTYYLVFGVLWLTDPTRRARSRWLGYLLVSVGLVQVVVTIAIQILAR